MDNNPIVNDQGHINVTDNNHIPTTMISYKPQTSDEVIQVYTDKRPYHGTAQNTDDHNVHIFHGQEQLKHNSNLLKSEYYDVTLDLSHDDIQQTLSANMPASCTNTDQILR